MDKPYGMDLQNECAYLLGKQVSFVQEQDHRCLAEPLRVAHLLKQSNRLVHAVRGFIFE